MTLLKDKLYMKWAQQCSLMRAGSKVMRGQSAIIKADLVAMALFSLYVTKESVCRLIITWSGG